MKNISCLLICLLVLTSCGVHKKNGKTAFPKTNVSIPLDDVLKEINKQYENALSRLSNKIEITEADVIFDVTNSNIIDGNISVLIFKADVKYTQQKESTVTYTLAKKDQGGGIAGGVKRPNFDLADMIVSTANNLIKAPPIGSLTEKTFEIDIVYSIELDGTLDLSGKLGNLGLDGSYERDHKVQHTITLKFKVNP